MKIIGTLLVFLILSYNLASAQDTLYIYKSGNVVKKCPVSEIDSITFKAVHSDPSAVASSNLVAYFPFEGNGVDIKGGLMPKQNPNVIFGKGRRGLAYQGVDNAYFLYDLPVLSKLRTLKAFSISLWLNEPQIPTETDPVPMILQIKNDDDLFWGNLSFLSERMGTYSSPSDSLNLKSVFHSQTAYWYNQFINFPNKALQASKWIHLIFEYDNITSTFSVFVNGTKLELPANVAIRYADSKPLNGDQPLFGDMNFNKPSQLVIGGWLTKIVQVPPATDAWMGWFNGIMDELRIYDRALTSSEAKALYDAEVIQIKE